ncbi:MAG: ferredoxin [Thermodesulfobacteriota bacterium]
MDPIPYIETEDCVGCGSCLEICPEVFSLNESIDKALVINPTGCSQEKIEEAMEICPVHCIHWEE